MVVVVVVGVVDDGVAVVHVDDVPSDVTRNDGVVSVGDGDDCDFDYDDYVNDEERFAD